MHEESFIGTALVDPSTVGDAMPEDGRTIRFVGGELPTSAGGEDITASDVMSIGSFNSKRGGASALSTATNTNTPQLADGLSPMTTGSGVAPKFGATVKASSASVAAAGSGPTPYSRPVLVLTVQLKTYYRKLSTERCDQKRQQQGKVAGHRYRDTEGHYVFIADETIAQRYIVSEVLGKGSFGTVIRSYDTKRNEVVALKITRYGNDFRQQAKLEVDVLIRLNGIRKLDHLVVKVLKVFDWQGHLCIVFEPLSYNLYQLVKCTKYTGVSLDLVRKFAYQLLQVLQQLEQHKPPVIHCDLKPENILLKSQHRSGVRVIDFGSACFDDKKLFKYIQSRFYRSPEVILRLPYGTAIDRWSLGCILLELHTGVPIFPGKTEAAQMAFFDAVLGPMPDAMLEKSPKRTVYFADNGPQAALVSSTAPNVKRYTLLKAAGAHEHRTLAEVLGVTTGGPAGRRKGQPGHEEAAYRQFLHLLEGLLRYQPDERLSCTQALAHPFLEPIVTAEAAHVTTLARQPSSGSPLAPKR